MPRYTYTAIAADGRKTKGVVSAETPYAARKQLRIRSIHPTSITELGAAEEGRSAIASFFKRTNKKQIIDFTRQMATLLKSGIKLTDALSVLTMQAPDTNFKNALTDICDRVITGESLTDAMKDHGDYLDVK
jgi:type II secretory pathway component PulF